MPPGAARRTSGASASSSWGSTRWAICSIYIRYIRYIRYVLGPVGVSLCSLKCLVIIAYTHIYAHIPHLSHLSHQSHLTPHSAPPQPIYHTVWHCFVMLGTHLHLYIYIPIYLYIYIYIYLYISIYIHLNAPLVPILCCPPLTLNTPICQQPRHKISA